MGALRMSRMPAKTRSVFEDLYILLLYAISAVSVRLRNLWETYSANFPKNDRHGPSQIPTEIDLPHKTFGSQLVDDSPLERPDVLPFSTYAACRILDTNPEDMENGELYEALCTMAACYVRADMDGICDCLQAYKLTDTLSKAARLTRIQQLMARSCTPDAAKDSQEGKVPGTGDHLADGAKHDKSFQDTVNGKPPGDPNADLLTLQGTIGALMHELEAILHEYLSFNWDRMEEVNKANAHLQRDSGLMCPWRPSGSQEESQLLGLCSHPTNNPSGQEHHSAVHNGEPSTPDSHQLPASPSSRSSSPSPNSRLRRMTLPDHLQQLPLPFAHTSQTQASPEQPAHAPAPPTQGSSQQGPQAPAAESPEGSWVGVFGQHQRQRAAAAEPSMTRSRRASVDQDGFDSDPESSSRALRLKALGNSPKGGRWSSPRKSPSHANLQSLRETSMQVLPETSPDSSPDSSPIAARSPPPFRRKPGLRRVQSEAQLLSLRSGKGHGLGSFGSQTGDNTRSFDEYLRSHRSRSPSPKSKAHDRAKQNWQRAQKAAEKSLTTNRLKGTRELITLAKLAQMLHGTGDQSKLDPSRQPICLLLGGGMAAGKSTVRKIIGEAEFWTRVGKDAVVVEADAMKSMDVIYKQLSKMSSFKSEPDVSSYVHEYSTKQAEALFVSAINRQKDVIFDGTMMWAPFVEQTIAMVRDYKRNYRRGPGYRHNPDGSTTEQSTATGNAGSALQAACEEGINRSVQAWHKLRQRYWEVDPTDCADCLTHKPYRIEMIGVTCDAGLAVARGVWRKLRTGRSVRSATLLRSHRLFSEHFERSASLVDVATLYHTGTALTTFNKDHENLQPKVIALRSMQHTSGDILLNPPAYADFKAKVKINDKATCRGDLYKDNVTTEETGVPVSQEGQMSTLREAFRQADLQERERFRESLGSQDEEVEDQDA